MKPIRKDTASNPGVPTPSQTSNIRSEFLARDTRKFWKVDTIPSPDILTAHEGVFRDSPSSLLAHAAEKPNFLIIFADDQGYGDVSTYHESDWQKP